MEFEPKSIEQQIDCLARLTGAPESFILQVKALFEKKGIPLETDARPYVRALEQAFRREHSIRTGTARARQQAVGTEKNFAKIGEAYVRQAERLRRLDAPPRPAGRGAQSRAGARVRNVTIQGDHRTYVAPTQRDEFPMVPGPSDLQ